MRVGTGQCADLQVRLQILRLRDLGGELGQQARETVFDTESVERGAATDEGEILSAGVEHPRTDLEQIGVTDLVHQFSTVDAARRVAPRSKCLCRVDEFGLLGEADVAEDTDFDLGGRHALGRSSAG
ncbi:MULTISPECIES: hypothetical protein [Nocardia]|uniref:hypothetical protein n=1 Tax=Nocardia TaxID=1817 RepID=UPI002FCD7671